MLFVFQPIKKGSVTFVLRYTARIKCKSLKYFMRKILVQTLQIKGAQTVFSGVPFP